MSSQGPGELGGAAFGHIGLGVGPSGEDATTPAINPVNEMDMEMGDQFPDELATSETETEELGFGPSDQDAITPAVDPAYGDRKSKILVYRTMALLGSSPLAGSISGLNSDLLDIELEIGERIRQAIAMDEKSIEDLERYHKPIQLLMSLSKQIGQLSQLELRFHRASEDQHR